MTTQISQRLAKEIKEEVHKLLGRGRTAFTCPLTAIQRADLYHDLCDQEEVAAYRLLHSKEYDTAGLTRWNAGLETLIEGKGYSIYFTNADYYMNPQFMMGGLVRTSQDEMRMSFPKDADWDLFVQWVQNTGIIERDFGEALGTLARLLDITNTLGQLTRALPEMYQYLGRENRDLLRAQKRSSNMPYEWASFSREAVDVLQCSMAKASLLPETRISQEFHGINCSRALLLS